MMLNSLTTRSDRAIARPLKVLIPLIQGEMQLGNDAGRAHYCLVGVMLIEAKAQVSAGAWGKWLSKNFDMSATTARTYMQWARIHTQNNDDVVEAPPSSIRQMTGATDRERENRQSKQQQDFQRVLRDVAREDFVQERQNRDDEIKLHRELAAELVDLGYRALATRLHPDRGGTKDAMSRLNRVREELRQFAQTRRFV